MPESFKQTKHVTLEGTKKRNSQDWMLPCSHSTCDIQRPASLYCINCLNYYNRINTDMKTTAISVPQSLKASVMQQDLQVGISAWRLEICHIPCIWHKAQPVGCISRRLASLPLALAPRPPAMLSHVPSSHISAKERQLGICTAPQWGQDWGRLLRIWRQVETSTRDAFPQLQSRPGNVRRRKIMKLVQLWCARAPSVPPCSRYPRATATREKQSEMAYFRNSAWAFGPLAQ